MKTRKVILRIAAISALLIVFAVSLSPKSRAQSQRDDDIRTAAQSSGGAALGTGVIRLLSGQSLRVSAVNVGGKAIPLQLYIIPVTEKGKAGISMQCDLTPAPGDAAIETFSIPDGTSNMLVYVQVRVRNNPNDIKELVPSVEIYDTAGPSGGPHYLLSGADFVEIRPIWVPS